MVRDQWFLLTCLLLAKGFPSHWHVLGLGSGFCMVPEESPCMNKIYLSVLFLVVSVLRSPSPTLKLNKHRFDVTKGSGTSYGELSPDITMSYKPIAPAPTGSNHTPPGQRIANVEID